MDREKVGHLVLDKLTVNPRLARRLSPAVACRYHALPVSDDGDHITVAMAKPDDAAARDAVTIALGAPSYVVEGNPTAIDALLAQLWPEVLEHSTSLLACVNDCPAADEVLTFARFIAGLLNAQLTEFGPAPGEAVFCDALLGMIDKNDYDMIIWGEPEQSPGQRLLSGPAYRKAMKRLAPSLLVARKPHWPLRRLLLLIQDEPGPNPAVDWVVRLAWLSGALVTVLTVVPPVPAMYGRYPRMQQGLNALLTTNTSLGRQMRRVSQQFVNWEVEATLLLRQGIPDQEIRSEVVKGDYDLIAVADQSCGGWRHWLMRDWIASLLSWVDKPVLIAKNFGGVPLYGDNGHGWGTADQSGIAPAGTEGDWLA